MNILGPMVALAWIALCFWIPFWMLVHRLRTSKAKQSSVQAVVVIRDDDNCYTNYRDEFEERAYWRNVYYGEVKDKRRQKENLVRDLLLARRLKILKEEIEQVTGGQK